MLNNNSNHYYPSQGISFSQSLIDYSQLSTQCCFPEEYIDEPIQSQLQYKDSLLEKLDLLFMMLTDIFLSSRKLVISIIDLDKTSLFNYDEGYYVLPEDTKEYKYSMLTLYLHSPKIAQMLKLVSLLYLKATTSSASTKRELYYNDVELFKSTVNIDSSISDLCSLLFINRFQLPVFPSAKGLFAGSIAVISKDCISMKAEASFNRIHLITADYFSNDYIIESSASFILVVEKETLFFNFINSKEYQAALGNSIVITGKGYPDYLTKYFLKRMSKLLPNVPIVYYGDYDAYGFEIYLNYLFGSKTSSRENDFMAVNCIKWVGLRWEMIFQLKQEESNDSLIRITQRDVVKIKGMLEREYFNVNNWALSINPHREEVVESLMAIHKELKNMLDNEYKAEGEYVISRHINWFILCLRQVLSI